MTKLLDELDELHRTAYGWSKLVIARAILRISGLESMVEQYQSENVTLREELAIKSGYVASLEDEVADYVDEVGALNGLNNDLQTKLDDIYNRTKSNGLVQMGDWNAKSLKSNET